MTYEDTLRTLGGSAQTQALRLLELHTEGHLTRDQFREAVTDVLAAHGLRGAVLGELSFAAAVEAATGSLPAYPVTTAAATAGAERAGLSVAIATVLEDPDGDSLATRLGRLAFAESVSRSQKAYGEALRREPKVEGWTRGLDSKACQLCRWWSWEGRVWPKEHPFQTHVGCCCEQVPTWAAEIESTVKTRRMERDRRAAEVQEHIKAELAALEGQTA